MLTTGGFWNQFFHYYVKHSSSQLDTNGHTFREVVDAATITPAAKPNNDFCSSPDISFRVRNTTEEPSTMPSIGISRPITSVIMPG